MVQKMKTEATVQSIFNLFFFNFQNPSLQQFSNLHLAAQMILGYYNKEDKYEKDLEEIKPLFFKPIQVLQEKYPELQFEKNPIDWSIPRLEWCYYRDTKFRNKLGKEYYIDSHKETEKKKLTMAEIIDIVSLFKKEMFKKVVKVMTEENLIDLLLAFAPSQKEISQLGGYDGKDSD